MRVGVLTGGGDCPGLNAVIRAVVRRGVKEFGYEFVGFRDGWRGPIEGLTMETRGTTPLDADADLVTAAVLNLLDNAQRHGARSVTFSTPAVNVLRVHDDGPGVDQARRRELSAAIEAQDYAGRTGLGLMLADLVARAHGGGLSLPESASGFVVELDLGTHEA